MEIWPNEWILFLFKAYIYCEIVSKHTMGPKNDDEQ